MVIKLGREVAYCLQMSGIKSLQELCRVKVHDFIPEGHLPAATHKLEIPVHVQKRILHVR